MKNEIEAELIGTRIVVWNQKAGTTIYRMGFYGKPVGIPKPKPEQDFNAPLMLDLMEGLYLSEKKKIKVIDSQDKKPIKKSALTSLAEETYRRFKLAYLVYKDMREKGYVVTPGIKFGADFAVYEHGPGIDHAPFLISVKTAEETLGTFEIVRAGRLATTVRKQFIIAVPDSRKKKVNYLIFKWWKA